MEALDFNITVPSSYRFLERYIKVAQADSLVFNFSRFMIELSMLDVKMYSWPPSVQAAAAIYTVNKILKRSPSWPPELLESTGYQEKEVVKQCAKDICRLMNEACS